MKTKKLMDKYDLEELLKSNSSKIEKLIADESKKAKGNSTLIATLRGEYAIKTSKDQYCSKGQDQIKNAHYEFSVILKQKELEKLLEKAKWQKAVCKKLLAGISHEIEIGSWY
ncbi:MAG: hypothetical protein AB8B67_04665 [Rickettsiaceae bacterium]